MTEVISFSEELNALREAGFTEEQIEAIWHLVAHVVIEIIKRHEYHT